MTIGLESSRLLATSIASQCLSSSLDSRLVSQRLERGVVYPTPLPRPGRLLSVGAASRPVALSLAFPYRSAGRTTQMLEFSASRSAHPIHSLLSHHPVIGRQHAILHST